MAEDMTAGWCLSCGARHFPRRERCRACWSTDVEPVAIRSAGVLETFTVVHRAPPGFDPPYTLATAVFATEGVRVVARLDSSVEAELGMTVRLAPHARRYAELCFVAPGSGQP